MFKSTNVSNIPCFYFLADSLQYLIFLMSDEAHSIKIAFILDIVLHKCIRFSLVTIFTVAATIAAEGIDSGQTPTEEPISKMIRHSNFYFDKPNNHQTPILFA